MTYKSILAHVEANAASDHRIAVAADLARRFGARVVGIGCQAFYPSVDLGAGYLDGDTVQALRDQVDANLKEAEARFRAATQGLPALWRAFLDQPAETLAEQARCADLVIASASPRRYDESAFCRAGDLIMTTGLPVILMPQNCGALPARRILIGWKNTLQARAAISAALPLLSQADEVIIGRVKATEKEDAEAELKDVADRLGQHGIRARSELRGRSRKSVCMDLLGLAEEHGTDLLVVGAYAHARMTEWVFGGVTNDLLNTSRTPVLFAR